MIYLLLSACILYILIGNVFFKKTLFFQKTHFIFFVVVNLVVLIWFFLQYKYSSNELISLALDELVRIIPKYFMVNLIIVALQSVFNFFYLFLKNRE